MVVGVCVLKNRQHRCEGWEELTCDKQRDGWAEVPSEERVYSVNHGHLRGRTEDRSPARRGPVYWRDTKKHV